MKQQKKNVATAKRNADCKHYHRYATIVLVKFKIIRFNIEVKNDE